MTLQIENPIVVGVQGKRKLVASKTDLDKGNKNGPAQVYEPGAGYSAPKPLQVWFKWGAWPEPHTDEEKELPAEAE